jgi:hypothetical protein
MELDPLILALVGALVVLTVVVAVQAQRISSVEHWCFQLETMIHERTDW